MKFTFHVSPSIKNNLSTQRIMKELSLSLLVVFVAAVIYYASAWGADAALHCVSFISLFFNYYICLLTIFAKDYEERY